MLDNLLQSNVIFNRDTVFNIREICCVKFVLMCGRNCVLNVTALYMDINL